MKTCALCEAKHKRVTEMVPIGRTSKGSPVHACPHCDGDLAKHAKQVGS